MTLLLINKSLKCFITGKKFLNQNFRLLQCKCLIRLQKPSRRKIFVWFISTRYKILIIMWDEVIFLTNGQINVIVHILENVLELSKRCYIFSFFFMKKNFFFLIILVTMIFDTLRRTVRNLWINFNKNPCWNVSNIQIHIP